MDDLTNDLPGVAVYLDDILVSGKHAEDHLRNFQKLLDCLCKVHGRPRSAVRDSFEK